MTEQRLTTLIKNQEPYYAQGSPLLLEAHAMHNDNLTGARIAQLKWLNLDSRTVEAAVVQLKCYDSLGNAIETAEHQYDHLTVAAGSEFGAKDAILLPNANTSRYEICLKGVAFAGGESWTADEAVPFEKLPGAQPHSLKGELLQQYKRELKAGRLGTTVRNQPLRFADLWLCACGSWQKSGAPCRSCKAKLEQLETLAAPEMLQVNLNAYKAEQERLEQERQERLRKEEAEREAQRQKAEQEQREEEERRAKARKKAGIIAACVAVLAIAFGCLNHFYLQPNSIYTQGEALLAEGKYAEAAEAFAQVNYFKDGEDRRVESWVKQGEALLAQDKPDYAESRIAFENAGQLERYQELCYLMGEELFGQDVPDYDGAKAAFVAAGNYAPEGGVVAVTRAKEVMYLKGEAMLAQGENGYALLAYRAAGNYPGAMEKATALQKQQDQYMSALTAGDYHYVALKNDGTVVAAGKEWNDRCNVSDWTGIIAVAAGDRHTIGLKADGTVVATGYNDYKQCEVKSWSNIIAVAAGGSHTAGLKSDGRVVVTGINWDDRSKAGRMWGNIVAIDEGYDHIVGLKDDGTVVALGNDPDGECDVYSWTNIVDVAAGENHTVGLKVDGTVVAAGANGYERCSGVKEWTDIIAVDANHYHTVGLKADGTVVAVGLNDNGQCNTSSLKDIVAISAGYDCTVGLRADGTVVVVGHDVSGRDKVSDWKNIGPNAAYLEQLMD